MLYFISEPLYSTPPENTKRNDPGGGDIMTHIENNPEDVVGVHVINPKGNIEEAMQSAGFYAVQRTFIDYMNDGRYSEPVVISIDIRPYKDFLDIDIDTKVVDEYAYYQPYTPQDIEKYPYMVSGEIEDAKDYLEKLLDNIDKAAIILSNASTEERITEVSDIILENINYIKEWLGGLERYRKGGRIEKFSRSLIGYLERINLDYLHNNDYQEQVVELLETASKWLYELLTSFEISTDVKQLQTSGYVQERYTSDIEAEHIINIYRVSFEGLDFEEYLTSAPYRTMSDMETIYGKYNTEFIEIYRNENYADNIDHIINTRNVRYHGTTLERATQATS